MRNTLIALLAAAALLPSARADEGMWLPMLISQRIEHMHDKGFTLDAEDIYSINQASLKDAVVLFGGGCTGEVVSPEGLLFTNHHCGYSQIQKHSSVEHDYLKDGFWALDRSDELPNPGLSVMFLEYMQDVTSELSSATDRQAAIDSLVTSAEAAGKGLSASVEEFYYGNQYFLFVYKEFSDVRLVGAPPSSIGKFGGDTDNWMWPRHTGDFSIFRIYAGPDNEPAGYSEDNVPYRPKKYFKIATGGVQEGDFTFIYGFPGSTREYVTSDEVRYIGEISDPAKIALRTMRLEIMKKYMDSSQDLRIRYSSKYANVSNAWKKWQGEAGGLERNGTVEEKEAYEARFAEWAAGTRYEGLIDRLDSLYKVLEPLNFAREYTSETALALELPKFATAYCNASEEDRAQLAEDFYKDWWLPVDKECFIALMDAYSKDVPAEFRPACFDSSLVRYGSIPAWADAVFGGGLATSSLCLGKSLSIASSFLIFTALFLHPPSCAITRFAFCISVFRESFCFLKLRIISVCVSVAPCFAGLGGASGSVLSFCSKAAAAFRCSSAARDNLIICFDSSRTWPSCSESSVGAPFVRGRSSFRFWSRSASRRAISAFFLSSEERSDDAGASPGSSSEPLSRASKL